MQILLTAPMLRSIPACAGKAKAGLKETVLMEVDPRVRGEGMLVPVTVLSAIGRSPRARGRRALGGASKLSSGSIPACAGKATDMHLHPHPFGVDPRVRGEG